MAGPLPDDQLVLPRLAQDLVEHVRRHVEPPLAGEDLAPLELVREGSEQGAPVRLAPVLRLPLGGHRRRHQVGMLEQRLPRLHGELEVRVVDLDVPHRPSRLRLAEGGQDHAEAVDDDAHAVGAAVQLRLVVDDVGDVLLGEMAVEPLQLRVGHADPRGVLLEEARHAEHPVRHLVVEGLRLPPAPFGVGGDVRDLVAQAVHHEAGEAAVLGAGHQPAEHAGRAGHDDREEGVLHLLRPARQGVVLDRLAVERLVQDGHVRPEVRPVGGVDVLYLRVEQAGAKAGIGLELLDEPRLADVPADVEVALLHLLRLHQLRLPRAPRPAGAPRGLRLLVLFQLPPVLFHLLAGLVVDMLVVLPQDGMQAVDPPLPAGGLAYEGEEEVGVLHGVREPPLHRGHDRPQEGQKRDDIHVPLDGIFGLSQDVTN